MRGAGLSAILSATVHILLHCCLLIIEALTGEVVELQEPAGFHHHIGAGVTRDGIVRDSLKERKYLSLMNNFEGKGICARTEICEKGIISFPREIFPN